MSSPSNKSLALRPYLEAITEHCGGLSKNQLLEAIISMAQDVPQNGRADFLKKIPGLSKQKIVSKTSSRDLFTQIQDLKAEIHARIESIEDGSYYDDNDAWGEYDDEGPPYLTEEMKAELESYFRETDKIFWASRFEEAKNLYHALLHVMDSDEESAAAEETEDLFYGWGSIDHCVETDCREVRARYARCLVEAEEDPKKLAKELLEAMNVNASVHPDRLELAKEKYPMLQDVVEAKSGTIPHWDIFLEEWTKLLGNKDSNRANLLLMETIMMTEGLPQLENLVHKWDGKQPRGYIYWIQQLHKSSDWKSMIPVCLEALQKITQDTFKAQVAEYLIDAARELKDPIIILTGLREKFLSTLNRKDLVACLVEAERQGQRKHEIAALLRRLPASDEQKALHILMLLLAGKMEEAFEGVKKGKAVGWSGEDGGTGLFFASLLTLLTQSPETKSIQNLMKRYADCDFHDMTWPEEQKEKENIGVSIELGKSLKTITPLPQQQKQWMDWAQEIARRRIDHILTNKHRKAYGRAAEILGALAEYHVIRKDGDQGRSLLVEHRDKKYNRFPAFKQELQGVLNSSKLIRNLLPLRG